MFDEYHSSCVSAEIYAGNDSFLPFKTRTTRTERMETLARRMVLTFRNVKIEEVTVENGLHDSRDDGNPVDEVLRVVTIDPIQNVEESINAQCE